MKYFLYTCAVALLMLFNGCGDATATVFFVELKDGDVLRSPVHVKMGVSGMTVEPAGEVREKYGHHHLLINQLGFPVGEIIPSSDSTLHYGKGQTEAYLTLPPGNYTLSLQFADGSHVSYGPSMATSVRVTVEE